MHLGRGYSPKGSKKVEAVEEALEGVGVAGCDDGLTEHVSKKVEAVEVTLGGKGVIAGDLGLNDKF